MKTELVGYIPYKSKQTGKDMYILYLLTSKITKEGGAGHAVERYFVSADAVAKDIRLGICNVDTNLRGYILSIKNA